MDKVKELRALTHELKHDELWSAILQLQDDVNKLKLEMKKYE